MKILLSLAFVMISLLIASVFDDAACASAAKMPVRVVVVATFELGNDSGDTPGEF
jgi:hypothetical protein